VLVLVYFGSGTLNYLLGCRGAPSRRGEVAVVRDALRDIGVKISEAKSPSLIHGGSVLYAGGMLFVGMRKSVTPL
jgi:N-dimethylarginine dimethylaminohydrolase